MTDTIVAECGCKVCVENAASLGMPAPLRATVPAHLLTVCKGKAHSLVYIAHQPGLYGAVLRENTGIRPLGGWRANTTGGVQKSGREVRS